MEQQLGKDLAKDVQLGKDCSDPLEGDALFINL